MNETSTPNSIRIVIDRIDRHFRGIAVIVVVAAVILGLFAGAFADTEEPNYDPAGEVYETADRVDDLFGATTSIRKATFLVDRVGGGPVLTGEAAAELATNSARARVDANNTRHLVSTVDHDFGMPIDGVRSVADELAHVLGDRLASAPQGELSTALDQVLDDPETGTGMRFTLAPFDEEPIDTPAFQVVAFYDVTTFDGETSDDRELAAEEWLRELQTDLRGDQESMRVVGVGIDALLTGQEQSQAGGPFIFASVGLIVLFVGALLRSYWASVVAASGLGLSLLVYNGLLTLIGIKTGSALIVFVIPVTLIAFGVDFFIHAVERVRQSESDQEGSGYRVGMAAIFPALTLAVATSVAAFLANVVGDIQAIVQFGIAAALGLVVCCVVLGWLCPRALLALEVHRPMSRSTRMGRAFAAVSFIVVAGAAGTVVTLGALAPNVGAAGVPVFIVLFLLLPAWFVGRRATVHERSVPDVDAEHDMAVVGGVVAFFARWRVATLIAFTALGAASLLGGLRAESAFEVTDFFSSKTDFIVGLERHEEHFGGATGGVAYVFVEGELTSPQALRTIEGAVDEIDASSAQFARTPDGSLIVSPNAASLVRAVMTTGGAIERVEASTGIEITDDDGDGLPDRSDQVSAIYESALADGVLADSGLTVFSAEQVSSFLNDTNGVQATRIEVLVTSFTDDEIILEARDSLRAIAADLDGPESSFTLVSVSGEVIASQDSLAAFTSAMVISLPVALMLTVVIMAIVLRSIAYAAVTIAPILVVVFSVWCYMWLRGLTINVVTATIAAIAVGVGIDFCTHFTIRFREELATAAIDPLEAARRAGDATGTALVLSALTSVVGFVVMATAPAPIFSSFGELMSVMIMFSLGAALLLLPSLLVVIAGIPDRKRARQPDSAGSLEIDRERLANTLVDVGGKV